MLALSAADTFLKHVPANGRRAVGPAAAEVRGGAGGMRGGGRKEDTEGR